MEPQAPTAGTVIPFTPRPTPPTPAAPGKKRVAKSKKRALAAKIAKGSTAIDRLYASVQAMTEEEAEIAAHLLEPLMALLCVHATGFEQDVEVETVQ